MLSHREVILRRFLASSAVSDTVGIRIACNLTGNIVTLSGVFVLGHASCYALYFIGMWANSTKVRERNMSRITSFCFDALVLMCSLLITSGLLGAVKGHNLEGYIIIYPYSVFFMGFFSHLLSLYKPQRRIPVNVLLTGTFIVNVLVFFCLAIFGWAFLAYIGALSLVFVWFLVNTSLHVITKGLVYKLIRKISGAQQILIVSPTQYEAHRVEAQLRLDDSLRYFPVGHLLSPYKELADTIERSTIVVIDSTVDKGIFRQIKASALASGKEVHLIPESGDLLNMTTHVDAMGDILTLSYRPLAISTSASILKRTLDVVAASFLLLIMCVPMLLTYILIPLTSAGPSIYRQRRVGLHGETFEVMKFRSMREDAEKQTGAVLAQKADPRVTTVGRLLRATRIDELPQLMNVLRGEMSLVGPRPERPEFVEQFESEIPGYTQRHRVRPGITGFAQIRAHYVTTAEDKLRYELWYIRHYNVMLDVKILFETLLVVINPSKARGAEAHGTSDRRFVSS